MKKKRKENYSIQWPPSVAFICGRGSVLMPNIFTYKLIRADLALKKRDSRVGARKLLY